MNPQYPIYIPSKGRAESNLTAQALNKLGVPYRVVVEPQEFDAYARVLGADKLLVLPFSNRGSVVPARNWIWERSKSQGDPWHWQIDDNIEGFYRLHRNLKTPVGDGTIFRCAEDFCDRYENLAQGGFQYFMFASRKSVVPPFTLNTRVYSCTLLRNDLDYRYRGIYNEDTDLSLQYLKAGYCTVLFNAFLCGKRRTMTLGGGNTPIYQGDGRLRMAQELAERHPDVTRVSYKWGRYQHHVDYSRFKFNRLVLKTGVELPTEPNNYGMVLQEIVDGEWITR